MRHATLTLGGQEYTINELPTKRNEAWRKEVMAQLTGVADLIQGAPATTMDASGIGGILRAVSETVVGSVSILTGLLFAYSPELAADRERIEAECYDSELMDALVVVLGLAFPFGSVIGRLMALSGQTTRQT